MKYKPGDEVFIKAEITDVHPESERPYFVQPCYDSVNWVSKNKLYCCDGNYEQGLADAWELAKRLFAFELDEREKMLGYQSMKAILEDLTPEYVMDRIESYEKEKEIKVGDVVEHNGFKGVVVHILPDGELNIVYENGLFGASCSEREYAKTGKHLEIADLLRQIGE